MKELIFNNWSFMRVVRLLAGIAIIIQAIANKDAIFGVAGFLYWQQVGCASGTCAITSHPVNSALYGAVLGMLFTDLFKK